MSCKNVIFGLILGMSGFLITKPVNYNMLPATNTLSVYKEIEGIRYNKDIESFTVSDDDENDNEFIDSIIKDNSPKQEKMLVAHYKFEKDLIDSSDNKNNGSMAQGDIIYEKGKVGMAARFDGESFAEITDNDSLNLDESFTISVWINKINDKEYKTTPILAKGIGLDGVSPPYILYHDSAISNLYLDLHNDVEWDSLAVEDSGWDWYNKWNMLTVTFDSTAGKAKFYINGALIGSDSWGYGALYNTYQDLYIGYGMLDGEEKFYKGLMDELRIYNYALTDKEIKALYNEAVPEKKVYKSIRITPKKLAIIKAKGTLNINAIGVMSDGTKDNINSIVTYKSSNKRVVTVSKEGKIKAIKKGTATVTVIYGKHKKVLNITVK